jgi:hypothetical protein
MQESANEKSGLVFPDEGSGKQEGEKIRRPVAPDLSAFSRFLDFLIFYRLSLIIAFASQIA